MVAEKSFVLELTNKCACEGCMSTVKKVLRKAKGVHSWDIDAIEGKITVSGTVEPHALIAALEQKDKKAELLGDQFHYSSNITTRDHDHQLQINVPAKPLQGVIDNPHSAPHQLLQLSQNNQGKGSEDGDNQLQIVPAKPVQGVHDNTNMAPELQQLSKNNQGKASDDGNDDDSLAMSATKEKQISHEHDLELKNYNKPFICSGCKELGFGPRFRCESCDYELHKECWTSKREISHDFFEGCTFKFFDHLSNKICDACGKEICGFAYHSKAKGRSLDLHPCCSNLQGKLCIDGYDFELHGEVLSKCKWCNKRELLGDKTRISGWSYISARKRCHFHVFCVTEMVREAWRHGLIDNIDSMALKKLDTERVLNSNRNDGRSESDHQFSRHTTKMFLKAVVGVLLGDPTMLLASVLVDLFTQ